MKRTSFDAMPCPVARTLEVLGDWWTLLIVRDAFRGLTRFKEFEASLGVSSNILAARLKALVDGGVLAVSARDQGGRALSYALTDRGRALLPTLIAMSLWGLAHRFEPGAATVEVVDRATGRRVDGLLYRTDDGRVIDETQVQVRPVRGE
jgi:DNA-binding HxlR family transcriptional regulator